MRQRCRARLPRFNGNYFQISACSSKRRVCSSSPQALLCSATVVGRRIGLRVTALLIVIVAGLAWTSLELLTHTFAKERFIHLLKGNPKYAGQRQKQERTAVQMCPRLVCFVHNALQVRRNACTSNGQSMLYDLAECTKPMC